MYKLLNGPSLACRDGFRSGAKEKTQIPSFDDHTGGSSCSPALWSWMGLPNQWHPYSYHPDEARLFSYMANMDPGRYGFLIQMISRIRTFHVLFSGRDTSFPVEDRYHCDSAIPSGSMLQHLRISVAVFLESRLVTVAMGVASVYLVYQIGHVSLQSEWGCGRLLLFAIAPAHVVDLHHFTLDVPMFLDDSHFAFLGLYLSISVTLSGPFWQEFLWPCYVHKYPAAPRPRYSLSQPMCSLFKSRGSLEQVFIRCQALAGCICLYCVLCCGNPIFSD